MNRIIFVIAIFLVLPALAFCQKVTYSDYEQEDNNRDINFEIIGKMNGHFLVYKNVKWRHKINIFNYDMTIKETVKLDFVPEKTFNVDFVIYPDHFFMIYQYQKRNTLHCMAVKLDGDAKKIGEPFELDTTQISILADNKIYTTINSEDKQKIMVFKIHKKYDHYSLVTLLFDSSLHLLNKSRRTLEYNERRDNYDNFLLDNDGNFVFTKDSKNGNRDNSNSLSLAIKAPSEDSIIFHEIDLEKYYIDEVKVKVDNLNKKYLINSFYYKKNRGSIEGLFTYEWDRDSAKTFLRDFTVLGDTIRDEAKTNGQLRFALDDFFIRQVFVKKDGGFLLTAEDYSTQGRGNNNPWNRWDYLNNSYYSPYSSYYYNPYYNYYRPLGSYNSNQSTRYYYANIMILSVDKNGKLEWSRVIHKDQFDDDNENFLSFSTMNSGGEIHFLFNDDKNKNQIIANHSITPAGVITRNPTLKSQERGYQFMPSLSKQVGASQLIIPCMYRSYICFARVDF
ncbi:hypothetical protein [Ferruginibacter sp. SUN106]|uniref:hypothetical protein n=1 Tax=Ferruginibacter sp. SUN106 TaxID=2978348 RepID=UPI003D361595